MPDRIYNGPVPEIDLVLEGGVVAVKRGDPVTVSDAEAKSLDEQGDWTEPTQKDSTPPEPPAPGA